MLLLTSPVIPSSPNYVASIGGNRLPKQVVNLSISASWFLDATIYSIKSVNELPYLEELTRTPDSAARDKPCRKLLAGDYNVKLTLHSFLFSPSVLPLLSIVCYCLLLFVCCFISLVDYM